LGNLFELILQLNTYVRNGAIIIADNFRYLVFILSTPVHLEVSSVLTGFKQTLLSP